MTVYYRKMFDIIEIPAPDDLVQGSYQTDIISLPNSGDYQRGQLMMSGEGGFVPATESGLAGAMEVCVLAQNISFTADSSVSASAYFAGTFNADRVILTWEAEGDDHAGLIEAIRPVLRTRGIFLN